ncbi:hypothetical protein K440DRAFT_228955 [Wilcoxina mikolae CBS 423.85]|nr:hypothetical protein K440DRAFT_228955 [Wilcoxina mikolae CBS 423.85]
MYYSIATPEICLKPLVCATSPRLHGPAAPLHSDIRGGGKWIYVMIGNGRIQYDYKQTNSDILCIPSQSRGSAYRQSTANALSAQPVRPVLTIPAEPPVRLSIPIFSTPATPMKACHLCDNLKLSHQLHRFRVGLRQCWPEESSHDHVLIPRPTPS